MKILICAFACLRDPDGKLGFSKGGETSLGWNIARQVSRFHQVWVFTDSGNSADIKIILEKERLSNIEFYYVGLPRCLNFLKKISGGIQIYAYLWQIKAYFIAKKLNEKIHFDVFHHVTYANDWMASYIGALLPAPYIRGPGGGAHRVPKNFVKEYSVKERLWQLIRSAGQWFFRHDPFFIIGQNRAKTILVCNREAFDALPGEWQKKSYFFPVNGISKEDFQLLEEPEGRSEKKSDSNFLILTAGKLIKIKGFDLAVKSFKIFSKKAPDAKLIIAGEGPELDNLKKMASDLGLEKEIFFEGWIPREKLLHKMVACDVFLFLSLRDGGGNVIVEAMAVGKPVVCFDISGPGFHIDEKCGIKIKPDSPEQAVKGVAGALEKLYLNKELRLRLGHAARQKAEKEYSWDRLGERLFKIYEEALLK